MTTFIHDAKPYISTSDTRIRQGANTMADGTATGTASLAASKMQSLRVLSLSAFQRFAKFSNNFNGSNNNFENFAKSFYS